MKYFNSYKLFHGKTSIEEYSAVTAVDIVLLAAAGIVVRVSPNEWLQGFLTGLMPFLCGVVAMCISFAIPNIVFMGNMRTNPGYRFFHSLADGAGHFRRSLIFSNMLSLVPIALYAAVGGMLFRHYIIVVMTVDAFAMLGFTNLTGHIRSPWVRIGSFCVIGFAYGFYSGIAGDEGEGFVELPFNVTVIVCAVTLAFYIVSLIVVSMRAEKLWNKED